MKFIFLFFLFFTSIYAQTIKDITNIVGIRENQLLGYGLVVGLAGTGDKSTFTMQSLQNLLRNSYIKIPTSSIKSKNI
ncbi:MAG: flagellar basal body P-ring protein FlgI, partial [Arcobacter sp.]